MRSQSSLRAPPPRRVAGTRVDPELAQELERIAQPVGDTLQHGADQRTAIVSKREPGKSSPRVRVRVRRPLAREVGEERQPLGARRPLLAPRRSARRTRFPPERVTQPAQRAGRGEHDSHCVPAARNGMAERMHACLRVRGERRQRRKHDA